MSRRLTPCSSPRTCLRPSSLMITTLCPPSHSTSVRTGTRSIHTPLYGTTRIPCAAASTTVTWFGHSVGIHSTIAGTIPSTGTSTTALTTILHGITHRSTMITGTARSTMDTILTIIMIHSTTVTITIIPTILTAVIMDTATTVAQHTTMTTPTGLT